MTKLIATPLRPNRPDLPILQRARNKLGDVTSLSSKQMLEHAFVAHYMQKSNPVVSLAYFHKPHKCPAAKLQDQGDLCSR